MSLGHPSIGRANYVHFKLRKEAHTLWIEMNCSLGLKSDGALVCHLLNTTRRNSTKVNDLNQSKLVHLSAIVRF